MRDPRHRMICFFAASTIALLAACASKPTIRSSADPSANLSNYRTFAFVDPLGTDRSGYSTIVSAQLKSAARRELEARGYTYAQENPDLLVNFNAQLNDKLRVDSAPTGPSLGVGYYGYRRATYSTWPTYETRIDQYTEGTLNVDIVDRAQKRLIWEGVALGRVSKQTRDDLNAVIDSTVAEIFKRFPGAARSTSA